MYTMQTSGRLLIATKRMSLREQLLKTRRNRWLDVGCGGNFEDGFVYIDTFPEGLVPEKRRSRYYRIDIVQAKEDHLHEIGIFDLVRMQHTLEHMTYEEGGEALKNCVSLLAHGGLLLVTVPDLRIHISKYLGDSYEELPGFVKWAEQRIPKNSPASFYFSVFTHSMPFEQHKWCYDYEGLVSQLSRDGLLRDIERLEFSSPLAEYPFTHNRPDEDLCVIARRI